MMMEMKISMIILVDQLLSELLDEDHDDNDGGDKNENYDEIDSTLTASCSLNCLINFPSSVRISWVFKR